MRVSVVATGIDVGQTETQKPRLVAVGGSNMTHSVATATSNPFPMPPSFSMGSAPVPAQLLTPRQTHADPAGDPGAQSDAHQGGPHRYAPPAPAQRPAATPRPTAMINEPSRTDTTPTATAPSTARSLFDIMTGIGRGRRSVVSEAEPQRAEPSFPGQAPAAPAAPRHEVADEGLDIPTFLRRQKS